MFKKKIFIVFLLPFVALSQNNDLEFWNKTGVSISLKKGFKTTIENHYRLQDSLKELKSIIPELGLSYKITDNFRLASNYRFYLNYNDDYLENPDTIKFEKKHRYSFDFSIKQKINPFVITQRLRYQNSFNSITNNSIAEPYFRTRLKIAYENHQKDNLLYLTPYISYETFLNLRKRNSLLDTWRFDLGFSTEIKNNEVNFFIRYQRSVGNKINSADWKYIFGLTYIYKI